MKSFSAGRMVLFLLVGALLAGCAAKDPKVRVLWPPPPEEPRMEFIGTYASEQDLVDPGKRKLTKAILGETAEAFFRTPVGIVSDGKGMVYISDQHLRNIRVYDFNSKHVEFYTKQPVVTYPMGLAMDSAGHLYAADLGSNEVKVFTPQRKLARVIGKGLLNAPSYMAINETLGRLYVTSAKSHEVVVFDLEGNHLFSFGGEGAAEGQLYTPQGLAISADGHVYVADRLNARIQAFDADGNFLLTFGERGDQLSQFEAPKDLAFDSEGNLHVVDQRRGAIYTYSPEGDILLVTGTDARSTNQLGFAMPTSIFIDQNDRIYVSDFINKRFAIWQYLSEAYLRQHPVTEEDLARIEALIEQQQKKEEREQ